MLASRKNLSDLEGYRKVLGFTICHILRTNYIIKNHKPLCLQFFGGVSTTLRYYGTAKVRQSPIRCLGVTTHFSMFNE